MEVKDALRRFRQSMGLNQEAFADRLGIKRQAYQPYETGKVAPSLGMVIKMAQTFDVSADYLLGLSDTPKPPAAQPEPPQLSDLERNLINAAVAFNDALQGVLSKRGLTADSPQD